jgi:hypothetical protein
MRRQRLHIMHPEESIVNIYLDAGIHMH